MKAYVLPYLLNHQANFPGDQFMIDRTTLPIGYKNEKGVLAFLNLVVVLDIYSRKLVGYAMAEKVNAHLYVQALQMAFKGCNHLPAEILCDNNLYKIKDTVLQDLIRQTRLLQVNWPINLPAHSYNYKSAIETFFMVFQAMHCKALEGYVGDRVRSKLDLSRPNGDYFLARFLKKTNLKTRNELSDHFYSLVTRYNEQTIDEESDSPNQVYATMKKPNVIALTEINYPLIFYRKTFQKILKSKIKINIGDKTLYYQVINSQVIRKINDRIVQVRYHEASPDYIFLYTQFSEFLTKIAIMISP